MKLFIAIVGLARLAQGASIRDVDFRNFSYSFVYHRFITVPDKARWMPLTGTKPVRLQDGRYTFLCDGDPCYLLGLDRVDFGHINGLPDAVAVALLGFHTGGTAQWQYLFIVAIRSGKPTVAAWLETGSRAYMGLRELTFDRGDLVLIVNDPDKREGDCCSTGTIAFRYRWRSGTFHRVGTPIKADDSQ